LANYQLRSRTFQFAFTLAPSQLASGPAFRVPVAPAVEVRRDPNTGKVSLSTATKAGTIHFTTDGSDPTKSKQTYTGRFDLAGGGTVRTVAQGPGLIVGPTSLTTLPAIVPRGAWKVTHADSEQPGEGDAHLAIDGDPDTYWHTAWGDDAPKHPHELVIDLGGTHDLAGFTLLPRQDSRNGRIKDYRLFLSNDPNRWGKAVVTGRLQNTTGLQRQMFKGPVRARYLRLVADSAVAGKPWTTLAELDVIPATQPK
jgi:beta-galactosidase